MYNFSCIFATFFKKNKGTATALTLFAASSQQYFSLTPNQHQLATTSQPAVLLSYNKSAPATSHSTANRVLYLNLTEPEPAKSPSIDDITLFGIESRQNMWKPRSICSHLLTTSTLSTFSFRPCSDLQQKSTKSIIRINSNSSRLFFRVIPQDSY